MGRWKGPFCSKTAPRCGQFSTRRCIPHLEEALGEDVLASMAERTIEEIDPEQRDVLESVLGWWRQNEIYRQMLLGVISELWVDYLTRVEALRVSIGLEAYAQRDPLVQYKSRASEMFAELLSEIRAGVIGRMFSARPRAAAPTQTQAPRPCPFRAKPAPCRLPARRAASPGRPVWRKKEAQAALIAHQAKP